MLSIIILADVDPILKSPLYFVTTPLSDRCELVNREEHVRIAHVKGVSRWCVELFNSKLVYQGFSVHIPEEETKPEAPTSSLTTAITFLVRL